MYYICNTTHSLTLTLTAFHPPETLRLVVTEVICPPFLKPARPEPTFDTQVFRLTDI